MSAYEVTDELVKAIHSGEYDLLVVNYANGDMVGHTGIFDAAVKAVEAVDTCLGRVYEAVMAKHGHMLVTADHGNVEQMQDYQSGESIPSIPLNWFLSSMSDRPLQRLAKGSTCRCCTYFAESYEITCTGRNAGT